MKRISSIILVMCLCLGTIFAQSNRHYAKSHNSGWDTFDRTLRTINNTASTAMLLKGLANSGHYASIRLGANQATLKLSGDIAKFANNDNLTGMDLGIVFGWFLGKSSFIFEPGLYLTLKGGEIYPDINAPIDDAACKVRMTMLEIPLVIKYDIRVSEMVALQPFAGGFLGLGIGGSTKFNGTSTEFDTFSNEGFKSFDAGLRAGCGIEINRFYLEAVADVGLLDLANSQYRDFGFNNWSDEVKSNCITLNVGVNF